MEQVTLDAFRSLFKGRADVYGSVEGRSNKEAVDEAHYQLHLEGKRSLGVYPLLDDGYCHFAAVDIDEKDFDKALKVRNGLKELAIAAYIAESKGKGYHVYVFAETRFLAKDIRWVLHSTLQKIGVTAEIFPKQDKLDEVIKYGNYINLPYFGMNSRQFVTASNTKLSLEMAYPKIVRTTEAAVTAAVASLPPEPPQMVLQTAPKVKTGKKVHPPCILKILKGVGQGQRDVAAFALARHYLDQMYLPEEVFALLMQWDRSNRPPINDMRVLQTKLQSAEKGYHFGCASILKESLLSTFCVGQDKCEWLLAENKEKKKHGLIEEVTFLETESNLYEQIWDNRKPAFLAFNKETGEITTVNSVEEGEMSYIPIGGDLVKERTVKFPTGIEEYGSTKGLCQKLHDHIELFVDLPKEEVEFCIWYILMTWVYDKLPATLYLRFKGDTGVGKTRAQNVIGDLCYKAMPLSSAITPAPVYRIMTKVRGTLILDEADFADSSEAAEIVKILNSGFEPDSPVIRCDMEDPNNIHVFQVFGPKLIATRGDWDDKALEARCHTIDMIETEKKIPPNIKRLSRYNKAVESLRNQLLLYRLRVMPSINPDDVEKLDLGDDIEPRLKQQGNPFALSFINDPEMIDRYKEVLHEQNRELIRQRADSTRGKVLFAFLTLAAREGRAYITPSAVQGYCVEHLKLDMKPQNIGRILSELGIKSGHKRASSGVGRYYKWIPGVMRRLRKRYYPEEEEFAVLFEDDSTDELL